ncbi:glycerophosphoryl diester phosphodiesterase [Idiomarina sp. A28L]|uniref:glycerophosphodiester phosphodiesterase n=1 Tax=Idiomarina sp. A28L TaxID=1036674 RepID=UPI0002138809|nr:glycerophosphodiester phosphodiesterase family protein [Idiomarina sp. A28L]EGN75169.1 glycerophosphoryl diester phosphodiesterase [Idiomarina sp. A28L]
MTTWISHRGYAETATENTAEAFDAAIDLGFEHLETDLRCSRDGHIVICHDPDLSRVGSSSVPIHALTRRELTEERLRGGESLLFFDELLDNYSQYRWILDIKPEQAKQTLVALEKLSVDAAVESFLTNQARYLLWQNSHQQILSQVFNDAFCLARQEECYRAGTAALIGLPVLGGIEKGQYYAVPPRLKGVPILTKNMVKRFHRHGAHVIGYLPETTAQHEQALAAGVDELLTNHAPQLRKLQSATAEGFLVT